MPNVRGSNGENKSSGKLITMRLYARWIQVDCMKEEKWNSEPIRLRL